MNRGGGRASAGVLASLHNVSYATCNFKLWTTLRACITETTLCKALSAGVSGGDSGERLAACRQREFGATRPLSLHSVLASVRVRGVQEGSARVEAVPAFTTGWKPEPSKETKFVARLLPEVAVRNRTVAAFGVPWEQRIGE